MDNYSTQAAQAIETFLKEDDWRFSFNEDQGVFTFSLTLKNKLKSVNYRILVHEHSYTVYVTSPVGADINDKDSLATMAEFICRANYGLRNGNFEMDVEDGEIRYKSFVDCDELVPSQEVVKNSIYVPAMMFERYGDGITGILFGGMSAEDAVSKCEED